MHGTESNRDKSDRSNYPKMDWPEQFIEDAELCWYMESAQILPGDKTAILD